MFENITKKVFKGTDTKGREVIKATVLWGEENAEVEGVLAYPNDKPVLKVTSKTIFKTLILNLEPKSLQTAYDEYEKSSVA